MQGKRKYAIRVDYFCEWSHEMAYVLGFISADGNVHNRTLSIEIHLKDREILEFIRTQLSPKSVIVDSGSRSRLRINSVELVKSLVGFNVIPRKSKTIRIDFEIPDGFLGDYVRGLFDGDGGVYVRRNGIESSFASASFGFLDDLQNLLGLGGSIYTKVDRRGNRSPIYDWRLYKKDSLGLRNIMYSSQCFSLKRKREVFFSDFYTPSLRLWTEQEIEFLTKYSDCSNMWLAEQLGKTPKAVGLKKWRLKSAK